MPPELTPDPTLEGAGSPAPEGEGTPTPPALTPEAQIEAYRKRQAGEAAARAVAERELAAAKTELEAFRKAQQSDADKDLSELAREKALREAAETRAAEAEAKAEGRILDAKYPKARAEYSEVVDEAKLAKLEALLDDGGAPALPPTPRGNNGPKDGTAAPTPGNKPGTIDDAIADLRRLAPTSGW